MVMVADGNFARHDVGESIDEHGRTGETVIRVGDSLEVLSVGTNGRGVVEEDHGPVVTRHETLSALCL